MKTEEIIPRIRTVINEFAGACPDSFSIETDFVLDQFVLNAMTQIASMPGFDGQNAVLNDKGNITYSPRPDGNVWAAINPPEDTLRIVSVWLEGWAYPVFEFLPAIGSKFLSQHSSVPGIGSGESQPAVFLTSGQGGKIIAHSVKKEGEYEVKYIAKPQPDEKGDIVFPSKYIEALIYSAAGLYLQSINEFDSAKLAFDTSASIIQTINLK